MNHKGDPFISDEICDALEHPVFEIPDKPIDDLAIDNK